MERFHSARLRLYSHYCRVFLSFLSSLAVCLIRCLSCSLRGGNPQGLQQIRESYRPNHRLQPTASVARPKNPPRFIPRNPLHLFRVLSNKLAARKKERRGQSETSKRKSRKNKTAGVTGEKRALTLKVRLCLFGSPHAWHSLQRVHIQWAGISYWLAPCSS